MSIDVIVPEKNKKAYERAHFAPAVHHDGLVYCSGIIGRGDTPEAEFRQAWQEVGELLGEVGLGYEDIGQVMSLSLQAVKSLLWRARDNVRIRLSVRETPNQPSTSFRSAVHGASHRHAVP